MHMHTRDCPGNPGFPPGPWTDTLRCFKTFKKNILLLILKKEIDKNSVNEFRITSYVDAPLNRLTKLD